jgi:hypothetical protein
MPVALRDVADLEAPALAAAAGAPLLDEVSEADLLAMPEDPDAVMAWLEGLAGGTPRQSEADVAPPPPMVADEEPAQSPAPSRSRRRRGRKAQAVVAAEVAAQADVPEPEVSAPPVEDEVSLLALPVAEAAAEAEIPGEPDESGPALVVVEETIVIGTTEPSGERELVADEAIAGDDTPVEPVAAEAPAGPDAVTTRPRRRGRKPKATPAEAEAPLDATPEVVIAEEAIAAEAPQPEAAVMPEEVASMAPPPAEETAAPEIEPQPQPTPTPPAAKPASWVDLLKPLQ